MAKQIDQHLEVMEKEINKQDKSVTMDTKIELDKLNTLIDANPAREFDLGNWIRQEIIERQSFLNGIIESGEDINDPETKAIISSCEYYLDNLRDSYEYKLYNGRGKENENN